MTTSLLCLTLVGLLIQALGLGYAAFGLISRWRDIAFPHDRFMPQWLRRLAGRRRPVPVVKVQAESVADISSTATIERVLDPSADVETRVSALEYAARDAERAIQANARRVDENLKSLCTDIESLRRQLTWSVGGAKSQARHQGVAELRHAGWGLVAAALGLTLQLPAAAYVILKAA